ncbi:MAG TPA: cytochrome c [Polyangiaceae bacterium]|nr:cytochrome c [Polyangiaceae bacterium]
MKWGRGPFGSLALVATASALLACGAAPHTRAAGAVGALSVRPVAWNPTSALVGRVSAVADVGRTVAVFGDAGATVLSAGAVVANDRAVTDWIGALAIRGAAGAGQWIVGIDGKGRLHYLRGMSSFEDVSARYGLDGRRVLGAAMLDRARVGFLLDGELAVADGHRVTRYGVPSLTELLGGGGYGAGLGAGTVTLFDRQMIARTIALPGVTGAALGADGRLFVTTRRALYASTDHGELSLLYDADGETLHGVVASGDHVWFADGTELGVVDGERVAETSGVHVAPDAKLAASPSGDVWVLASGTLQRFARAEPEAALGVTWATTLAPIFARSCASCHQAGGVAGVDLSTAEGWQSERSAIRARVVGEKTMPPEGHPLLDADRAAIEAWTEHVVR